MPEKNNMNDLLEEYRRRVEEELGTHIESQTKTSSREYQQFKSEYMPPHMSYYEKLCNLSEKILKVRPDKKKEPVLQEAIDTCHLSITPAGATSFSLLGPIILIIFGSLFFYLLFKSVFFIFFFFIIGVSIIGPLAKLPMFFADNWRLKASNQMVLCIFYVVTYMRHTSNLENAIDFASEHLAPPLSLDMRKVLWDVETEKYESVKESLEAYLATWKKYNMEFAESFHLIESSLYEGSEDRRLNSLDKSLDVILTETYEKMLHYAHNLKSPITMLHMLGIILPILGLVILPLVVSFMEEAKWFHISMLYNVALPIGVYIMGRNILSRRPTGYGDTDISEENPELKKYRNILINIGKFELKISPFLVSVLIGSALFLVGMSPIILHLISPSFDIPLFKGKFELIGYRTSATTGQIIGPFGLGASVLSLAVTLAFGLGIGLYFRLKSKNVIKIRERSKQLEQEFASALFQLGNRLGDGIPAEMAVGKVASVMEGTVSGSFFELVSQNIRKMGMSVQRAIFDPKYGALVYFPSNLIESSMKVLIESVKKGPTIAAQALMNVSRYIKEIHKVNERLKDLMADIISSMTSQIKFLTPVISGIVIGITSMITTILGKLGQQLSQVSSTGIEGAQEGMLSLFGDGIPTFYFQIIVGIYVVQITYILTILANGIENGSDKLNERYLIGNNLVKSTILYSVVSFAIMILFNLIATSILTSTIPGGT